jgi:type IV pilus assembly protein PilY1
VPAEVAVLDNNEDGTAYRIYFGDTGGNLWRVDLSGNVLPTSSQDTWQINKLASFHGGSITTDRRIFNGPDVVRIRLEGKPVDAIIIGTGDRTNPNATDVDNRVYLIRDRAIAAYSSARPSSSECTDPDVVDVRCGWPISEAALYDITDNDIITGTGEEKITAIESLRLADGWLFELPYAGEKSLASSFTIDGKVYIPTFTPSDLVSDINSCVPRSGTGQMYVMDIYDGDRGVLTLGPIIPDTPTLYFTAEGNIVILPNLGSPGGGGGDCIDCSCNPIYCLGTIPPPYGNFWFQEAY